MTHRPFVALRIATARGSTCQRISYKVVATYADKAERAVRYHESLQEAESELVWLSLEHRMSIVVGPNGYPLRAEWTHYKAQS